jgi:hypothetical protein
MTTETSNNPQKERMRSLNEYGISVLADMAYQTKANIASMEMLKDHFPNGRLKEFVRLFTQNQTVWNQKLLRIFDDMSRKAGENVCIDMREDLEGPELMAYTEAVTDLKKAKHMEGVAWLIKLAVEVEDMEAIATNLKLIIQNQLNKEKLCK